MLVRMVCREFVSVIPRGVVSDPVSGFQQVQVIVNNIDKPKNVVHML